MKAYLILLLLVPIGIQGCGKEAKATEVPQIECRYLNSWDFKRCENSEVICYMNNDGLSCKWK